MVTVTAASYAAPTAARKIPAALPRAALVSGGDLLVRDRERPVVPTGFWPLDALLPAGGVRPGSLVEWLAGGDTAATGGGAATLAFAVACRLAAADGAGGDAGRGCPRTIVVVDRTGWFHPPAVLPWLGDDRRLVVARPSRDDDEIWAIDQALRCTGVAAVLAWPRTAGGRRGAPCGSRRASLQQWSTAMRRWQLAAAASGGVGFFVRPLGAVREPSWAEARIAVSPLPGGGLTERRLRLTAAGGGWSAAAGQRTAEIVLDVARGEAGASSSGTRPLRPIGISVTAPRAGGMAAGRNGDACRAS